MWADALEQSADMLEKEALRRAVKGVKKPVYQGGELVGHVQVYSDSLMQTLLKAARPDKFKDRVQSESTTVSEVKITRTIKR